MGTIAEMNAKLALLGLAALVAFASVSYSHSYHGGYAAAPYSRGYSHGYHGYGYSHPGHYYGRHRRSLGHYGYSSYHPRSYSHGYSGYSHPVASYGHPYSYGHRAYHH